MPSLRVTFRQSGFSGRVLNLDQPVLRLGREPVCEVLFDENTDRVVSRIHAELRWNGDTLTVHPNGERFVYCRGQRVQGSLVLQPGDVVELAGPGGPSVEVWWPRAPDVSEAATQADLPVLRIPGADEKTPPAGSAPFAADQVPTPVEAEPVTAHDAPTFKLSPEQASALGLGSAKPPSTPPAPAHGAAGLETAMQGGTAVLSLDALRAAAAATGPATPPPVAAPYVSTPPVGAPVALQALPVAAPDLGPRTLDLPTSVIAVPHLDRTQPNVAPVPRPAEPPPAQRGPYVPAATAVPQMVPREVAEAATSMLRLGALPPSPKPHATAAEGLPAGHTEDATSMMRIPAAAPAPAPISVHIPATAARHSEDATAMMRIPSAPPAAVPPPALKPNEDDLATSMLRVKAPVDDADAPTPPAGLVPVKPVAVAAAALADSEAPTPPSGIAAVPPPSVSVKSATPAPAVRAPPPAAAAPPPAPVAPAPAPAPAAKAALPFGTKLSSAPPPEVVAAAARLAEQAKALGPPGAPAEHASTMMMPALNAEASTQFIRIDELAKPPPAKRPYLLAVIAGGAALVLLAVVWFAWSKYDQSRRAELRAARIEELRVSLEALAKAGKANAPEYAQLEAEIQREEKALEEDTGQKAPPRPKKPVDEGAALAAALAKQQAAEEAAAKAELGKFGEARALWAKVKAKELEALPKPKSQRSPIWEERRALKAEYEAFVAKALPGATSDKLIREAIHAFGESGATAPPKFLAEVKTELKTLTDDPMEREMFIASVQSGEQNGVSAAVTTALADQGLPVELYFLGYVTSHLDPKSAGPAEPRGIPKGFFRLFPQPAQSLGLVLGPRTDASDYDAADERHLHEKESKLVARLMRDLHRNGAAGSVLLVIAGFDGGDTTGLGAMKSRAGIGPTSKDPAEVSYWKVYEANGVPAARRTIVARTVAAAVAGMHPEAVGLPFKPPFKHVEIDER